MFRRIDGIQDTYMERKNCRRKSSLELWARVRNHIVTLLIVAGLLAPSVVRAQSSDVDEVCRQPVFVQPGDTLSVIAARYLGSSFDYEILVAATNAAAAVDSSFSTIENPDVIAVGWKLCVPSDNVPLALSGGPTASPSTAIERPILADEASAEDEDTEPLWADRMQEGGAHPLSIQYLRDQAYPGSPIVIEQTLASGSNYSRHIVSYMSEGLKINALMTIPLGDAPEDGWPAIVFNHGYIPPEVYRPDERYVSYVDGFARNGYVVFRPDYRGHADSEGEPRSAYGTPDYTIDVLNALAALRRHPEVDPERIGMWGHSMGGYITVRSMVTAGDIKAGVIWAGVVASYPDLIELWRGRNTSIPARARRWRTDLIDAHGMPAENPDFWTSISANSYVADLSGPIQLHHGTADASVPVALSDLLHEEIVQAGGDVEYYVYEGDDHNLSGYFSLAMQRSLDFFDRHVKRE